MSAVDIAAEFIKAHEGLRLTAYKDIGGVLTIGYGHTGSDVKVGAIWDQSQVDKALKTDLQIAFNAVKSYTKVPLSDKQAAALTSFVFNLGQGAFRSSTLLIVVNNKDWIGSAKELIRWDKVGGEEVKGLLIRRLEEAALFLRGS